MATTVGKLAIFISANAKGFIGGLQTARKKLDAFATKAARSKAVLIGLASSMTAAAGAATAVGYAFLKATERIDNLAKTAIKLGTTVETLDKLRYAGERSGLAVQTVDMAMQRFTRRVAEAAVGTGEAQGALRDLGLDAVKLNQLPLEQKMLALAKAFQGVTDEGQQLRIAFKLFDSEGAALVTMLKGGEAGLQAYFDRAVELGIVTEEQAEKAQAARDALTDLGASYRAITNELVTALTPSLIEATDNFTEMFNEAKEDGSLAALINDMEGLAKTAAAAAAAFAELVGAAKEFSGASYNDANKVNIGELSAEGKKMREAGMFSQSEIDAAMAKSRESSFFGMADEGLADYFLAMSKREEEEKKKAAKKTKSAVPIGLDPSAEKMIDDMKEGEKLKDKMKTEDEKFAEQTKRLKELLQAGAIDQETYNRALTELRDSFLERHRISEEAAQAEAEAAKLQSEKVDEFTKSESKVQLKPKETPVTIDKTQFAQMANPQALLKGSAAAISKSLELRQRREKDTVTDAVKEQQDAQVERLDKIIENTDNAAIVIGIA